MREPPPPPARVLTEDSHNLSIGLEGTVPQGWGVAAEAYPEGAVGLKLICWVT